MPYTLTNIQNNPMYLENYPIIGEYIQGGHGTETDYYNASSKCVLPGEPLVVFGRLCISKDIILPRTFGTVVFGCWVNFLLDPALAAVIKQDANVYYDLDKKVDGSYISGYATGTQPTNGFLLGKAVGVHGIPGEITLSGKSAVAASPGDDRIFVLLTQLAPTTYGTVYSALSTS